VHLIEGADLLTDLTGYSMDLAHPGDFGMIEIAENLAQRIRPFLSPAGEAPRSARGQSLFLRE